MNQVNPVILIVDDEENLRRNLQDFLEDEGFEVITVGSGEEGLDMLAGQSFDFSIVDIRLPGMDGNAFIMKAHLLQPQMKCLIFTGSVDYRISEDLRSLGMTENDIFRKPLNNLPLLVQKLRENMDTGEQA
jgi:two-component system, OmpR family, response regulator